jgi:hypothetical protein
MKTYLITYDLTGPSENYEKFFDRLQTFPDWCQCLDSLWVINSNATAVEIRDRLIAYIDESDKLIVLSLAGEGAWENLSDEHSDWLNTNL